MSRSPSYFIAGRSLARCAALLVLLSMALGAIGAVSLGPKPGVRAEEEKNRTIQFQQARTSFEEKLRVGQERYTQRQENRAKAIEAMAGEFANRQRIVVLQPQTGLSTHRVAPAPRSAPWLILATIATLGLILLGSIYYRGQRSQNARQKSLSAMPEDPTMVEFLRALHEQPEVALPSVLCGDHTCLNQKLEPAEQAKPAAAPSLQQPDIGLLRKHVAVLQASFSELTRTSEDSRRLQMLRELIDQLELVRERSLAPDLRPVWLLASAMRGLLNQLVTKASNITPSALRTAAAALDLAELLCSRPLRPDLATEPPARLLAVDDDPISRMAVALSLKKAFTEPHLAADGLSALVLAAQQTYDVIFLDVEMPGMDGFELCSKIHETESNRTTPIVFVTSHSDFDSRAKSALSGARDLMAKPFLAFEITLKALTLVLKSRLQAGIHDSAIAEREKNAVATSARDSSSHKAANPVELALPSSNSKIAGSAKSNPNANLPKFCPQAHVDSATSDINCAPQVVKVPALPIKVRQPCLAEQERSVVEFAKAFYTQAPAHLQILGQQLAAVEEAAQPAARNELLAELFIGVHTVCSEVDRAHLGAAFRVSFALEAMLKKLLDRPKLCSASCLQTAAAGLEALEDLCRSGTDLDLTNPPVKLLVVDDDPLARRALEGALQLAFGRPDGAESGEAALALAEEKPYDLILLDVLMPGMDGFATCVQIHQTTLNSRTPVVFVTSQADTASRFEAAASGGCGFIPKPVLPSEITLLALTCIVGGRLQQLNAGSQEETYSLAERERLLTGEGPSPEPPVLMSDTV